MAQGLKITPSMPLKLGWIPYWNLFPLKQELIRIAGDEIEFHRGHPAQINKMLTEGKISLAPCSSVCLLKNASHEMAFPLGVASNGPVHSVYIGLQHEDSAVLEFIRVRQQQLRTVFKQAMARHGSDSRKAANFIWKAADASLAPVVAPQGLPPLSVTPASATSSALGRILYRLWFGEAAFEIRAAETGNAAANSALSMRRPMELLIGDEALQKRANFRKVIDLGEAWRELTDLPFVFAVFQSASKTLSPYWRQKMFEAAELAQARMRIEPSVYYPDSTPLDCQGHVIDLGAYWKNIHYRLTPNHFKGLALYLSLARSLSPESFNDLALAKICRWEAMSQPANSPSM